MTVTLNPATVANSIAAISISGVTMLDIDQIPQSGSLITPVLFPQPGGWLSDIAPTRESFGTGASGAINFMYTLHYVFLFAEAGSGLSQLDNISPLVAKLKLILEALLTNDVLTGLVDMMPAGVEGLGIVQDPSGNQYWGALFSLRCLEFAQ